MHQPVETPSPCVKFIRMNTGEDIIAELISHKNDDDEFYVLVNPLKIIYTISESHGGISIALMQWIFPRICDKQEFPVYSNDIITMSSPSKQMETYYWNVLNKFDNMGLLLAPTNKNAVQYDTEEDDEDEIEPTEEEMEYINKMLDEIKNGKRKLH